MKRLIAFAAAIAIASPALAHDLGFAGLFSKSNTEDLPELTIAADKPLGEDWTLKSGTYYEVEIEADGSAELQLDGAEFFRAIWIDEIVINDMEVRPMALHSLEFDDEGTVEIGFIAIKPGSYVLKTQSSQITVKIQ